MLSATEIRRRSKFKRKDGGFSFRWEEMTEGETGSCSDGRGHAQ